MSPFEKLPFSEAVSKSDRSRLRLVEAALRVLAEKGALAITFESVGDAAEVHRSQVRYHFSTLAELLRAAVQLVMHQSQTYTVEYLASAKNPRERLEKYVEAAVLSARDIAAQPAAMLYLFAESAHDRELAKLSEIARTAGVERLALILEELLAPWALAKASLIPIAQDLRTTIIGIVLEMHTRQEHRAAPRYAERAVRAVLAQVGGALPHRT